jgi:hypothetical protein
MARRSGKARIDRAQLLRTIRLFLLPALATIALAAAAGAYALARIVEQAQPDIALALMPSLPPALDAKAQMVLADAGNPDVAGRIAEARALAQRSLRSSALNPGALRMLGAARAGRLVDGAPLIAMALRLSRRDIGAQLFQIEIEVGRNNIPATLRHYDQVLRVSPSVGPTLYPILLSASDDRTIRPHVRRLVAEDPPWLARLAGWTIDNPDHLVRLARLVPWIPADSEAMSLDYGPAMIDALVARNLFDAAYVDYLAYSRSAAMAPGQRRPIRPFDWTSVDNFETGSDPVADRAGAFDIFADAGASGEVLSKLTRLAPGAYRFAFTLGAVEGAGAAVHAAISCADGGRPLQTGEARIAARAVRVDFQVPPGGCRYQWIRLNVRAGQEPVRARLDRLTLARAG